MSKDEKLPASGGAKHSDLKKTPSSEADVSAFLNKVRTLHPATTSATKGRLIFAMDATMSRRPSWDLALGLQAEMFHEVKKIGGLDVQLIYFRGFNECKASKWVDDPEALAALMTQVECRGGHTQIGKILTHARRETEKTKVSALVYVGDAMEENIDDLASIAGELGLLRLPVFLFQENDDPAARACFKEIARLTQGAYAPFNAGSAAELRDLLLAVAVYAAGGKKALEDLSHQRGGPVQALLQQLK